MYEEKDPTNYIGVNKTKSDKFIFIGSGATLSSEYRYIDANKPEDAFKVFQPRMKEVLYDVDHANDKFYIRTNLQAKNFKLMTCAETKTDSSAWTELIAHNDKILIQGFDLFKNYMDRGDQFKQMVMSL